MNTLKALFFPQAWKSQQRSHTLYLLGLMLCIASLPLSRAGLSIGTGILLLNGVLYDDFRERGNRLKQFPWALAAMFFVIWHIFATTYSLNPAGIQNELLTKVPFFIFVGIIASSKPLSLQELRLLVWIFVISCVMAIFIFYGNAFLKTYQGGFSAHNFTHHAFTRILDMHAIYFAMFLNFSAFGLVWLWYTRDKEHSQAQFWQYLVLGIFLISVMATL